MLTTGEEPDLRASAALCAVRARGVHQVRGGDRGSKGAAGLRGEANGGKVKAIAGHFSRCEVTSGRTPDPQLPDVQLPGRPNQIQEQKSRPPCRYLSCLPLRPGSSVSLSHACPCPLLHQALPNQNTRDFVTHQPLTSLNSLQEGAPQQTPMPQPFLSPFTTHITQPCLPFPLLRQALPD